jgi:hypothetical protein
MRINKRSQAVPIDVDLTADIIATAEGISLMPADQANAAPRPDGIAKFWHELEYEKYAAEQPPQAAAAGELAARADTVRASGLQVERDVTLEQLELRKRDCAETRTAYKVAFETLGSLTRRASNAASWYYLRWFLLLTGDIAGVAGAAVMFGEMVSLAVLQAVASAVAAVTAGLVGEDLRDIRLARRRQRHPNELTAAQQPYAHLLTGATVDKLVKAMIWLALSVGLLVFGGILALRTGAEDGLAGVVFGCLAGAICAASVINSYYYTDEVADLLDRARRAVEKADKALLKLAKARVLGAYGEAVAAAASIKAEYQHRGLAAQLHAEGLPYGISRRHPGILGHGQTAPAPQPFAEVITTELRKPPRTNGTRNGTRR